MNRALTRRPRGDRLSGTEAGRSGNGSELPASESGDPPHWRLRLRNRARGGRENPSNVRNRLLSAAIRRANEELASSGKRELRDITPHSLRRTCASLLFVAGADVPYVMAQMGHTAPKMTLGVYA